MLCVASVGCVHSLASDESALLALKGSIDSETLANNWTEATSVCNWIGVTCGGQPPRVTALNLSSMGLHGTIPPLIGNLSSLALLSLSRNHLDGPIPSTIGNCKWLKELNLSENSFTGALPSEIGKLSNLEALRVNDNFLKGFIPSTVFNISSLQVISLYGNQFSGSLPRTLGIFLPNLVELNLQGNYLRGTVPSSISSASKLTLLNLADNSFTGFIPNTVADLRNLQNLDLPQNNLTSESSMPESSFISLLINSRQLRKIELSGNPLDTKLHMSIGNLSTSLEYLRLTDCKLNGSIPTEIGNLSSLVDLKLGRNGLTGVIPDTIGRLEKLQGLHLQDNRLNGTIQSDLCKLSNLVELLLDGNELSGSIPECLGDLTALRDLSLSSNRLTSTIPLALWNLRSTLAINLSSNSFYGSLPDTLSLPVVIQFDLSKNQLSGGMPHLAFIDATYISLAENRLQGDIPRNRLQGDIPPIYWIAFPSLEFLDLSHNNLSGVIPQEFVRLVYLKYLNLSFNELVGEIPSGGPFDNFTAESYLMNRALCGAERLRVPRCPQGKRSRRTRNPVPSIKKIWLIVALICILSLLSLTYYLIKTCNKRRIDPLLTTNRTILYQEIVLATDGFSERNLISTGSYGPVYKGTMREERSVAIKVFNVHLGGLRSFQVESELLANIRHSNLVKLMNSCCDDDFRALVLEYMPNGTLDKWLYTHNYFLSLLQRLDIMIEVASAVCYLHSIHVIHCDLKPSNVLLDEDMVARVSDFSISKRLVGNAAIQTRTMATVGYMAPEYGSCGTISEKSDIYSFGILLMETFTAKKPTDDMFGGEMNLRRWIFESLPHAVERIIDVTLLQSDQENIVAKRRCIKSIMKVAWFCTSESSLERKTMKEVESELHGIKSKFLVNTELAEFQETPGDIAPRTSYQELKLATDNFSERNLLDLWEFGFVYKGVLKDKRTVAIKIFDSQKEGLRNFEVQSEVLRFIRHRNVVKILKCCNDVDFKALVLEYMPFKSLQKWLYRAPGTTFLNFLQRLDLMINMASALVYLHSMRVIHCNLNPSNVLLDEEMVAHVSGFRLAKCLDKTMAAAKNTGKATAGYIAPEYESMGTVSEKTDVYSFGILLMETFATIRPLEEEMNWRSWICYSLEAVDKIVDLNFLQTETEQEHLLAATRCLPLVLKLAHCCTAELADERKTMTEVESELVRIKKRFTTDNSN